MTTNYAVSRRTVLYLFNAYVVRFLRCSFGRFFFGGFLCLRRWAQTSSSPTLQSFRCIHRSRNHQPSRHEYLQRHHHGSSDFSFPYLFALSTDTQRVFCPLWKLQSKHCSRPSKALTDVATASVVPIVVIITVVVTASAEFRAANDGTNRQLCLAL